MFYANTQKRTFDTSKDWRIEKFIRQNRALFSWMQRERKKPNLKIITYANNVKVFASIVFHHCDIYIFWREAGAICCNIRYVIYERFGAECTNNAKVFSIKHAHLKKNTTRDVRQTVAHMLLFFVSVCVCLCACIETKLFRHSNVAFIS